MIRLLKFLFTGSWHEHKFELIEHHKINRLNGDYNHGQLPTSIIHTYVSRCECGKIESRQISV